LTLRSSLAALSLVAIVTLVTPALAEPPPLPPEAFAACSSKASGDTCSVSFRGQTLEGTCAAHPTDSKLFCRLHRPPPPPDGQGPRGPEARGE